MADQAKDVKPSKTVFVTHHLALEQASTERTGFICASITPDTDCEGAGQLTKGLYLWEQGMRS